MKNNYRYAFVLVGSLTVCLILSLTFSTQVSLSSLCRWGNQVVSGLKGGDKTELETGTSIVSLAHFLGNYSFSFLFYSDLVGGIVIRISAM